MLPGYFKDTSIDGRYTGSEPYFVLAKEAYFENGKFVLHAYVLNGSASTVCGLDILEINVYDANGKLIASGNFYPQNFDLESRHYLTHTFHFAPDCIASYAIDMSNIYVSCVYGF